MYDNIQVVDGGMCEIVSTVSIEGNVMVRTCNGKVITVSKGKFRPVASLLHGDGCSDIDITDKIGKAKKAKVVHMAKNNIITTIYYI